MERRTADTSLTPAEKEDRETDRRVRRQDPAPSRKRKQRRAPRDDLRKKRVRPDDPDLKPLKRRKRKTDVAARPWVNEKLLNRWERSIDSFFDDVDEDEDLDQMLERLEMTKEGLEKLKKEDPTGGSWFSRMVKRVSDLFSKKPADSAPAPESVLADADEEVKDFVEKARTGAASYGALSSMAGRVATYHGILDQRGNPTDPPNTGWRSLDKRHIGEEHFKSILKQAGELLKDDWLKYGWDGGSKDAPVRAALDMTIQVADGGIYQSKIDAETYDMLLNRLAGWGHDSFSDTVIPMKASKTGDKRSASAMPKSQEYQNIVRIANELRTERPRTSLELLRNLTALASGEIAPSEPEPKAAGDLGEITFKSMSDDDFDKLKGDAKKDMDKLFDEKDVDAFLKGMEGVMGDVQKKTACIGDSVLVPLSLLKRLAASNQEAKAAFGHVILAASKRKKDKVIKKDDKSAAKKKGDKDKAESKDKGDKKGAPPFGGKKAPPFPPKKGKKASIEESDLNW